MRLLAATDVHSDMDRFSRILDAAGPVDVVLLGGDLTNFGSARDAEAIVRMAGAEGARVLAVAGNCDSASIDAHLAELGVSLFRRGIAVDGVGFVGMSAMPPWQRTMYHFSEEELADTLETGRRQLASVEPLVVLSHCPPHDTRLDRTTFGRHVGSTALRAFVDRVEPELVVCGHIHEARGVDRLGRTTLVNCGPANRGCYAVIELTAGGNPVVELRA
ncbi:MAG: metallophosphoesterase family protein [Pirellulales bacterium]|nr:metallophosphoesterase family protein [Pirellulales bacterium]